MNTTSLLLQCIDHAERLKIKIKNNSKVPNECLGGTMKPMYEKVRVHQLDTIQEILQKMQA